MKKYVAYFRVSTDRQGQSGLGLDAQRDAVSRFISSNGMLVGEFQEVESGKRHKNRPQLLAALEQCKKLRATLVIAKLDRLGRNVAFISALMESNVEFVCCDNPHATRLMLHMLAAFAEHEREIISQRTIAALARVRAELRERGFRRSLSGRIFTKLGGPDPLASLRLANIARNLRPPDQRVLDLMTEMRGAGHSYREVAMILNARGWLTPHGYRWHSSTARAVFRRLTPEPDDIYAAMANVTYEEPLPEPMFTAIPFSGALSAGRRATEKGITPMYDLNQAMRMLDTFASVGARSFTVTKIDINKKLLWGKPYSPVELRDKLPDILRIADERQAYRTPEGQVISAGCNIVVRPTGPDVQFIQLDDLDEAKLARVQPCAHLNICTSAGNHQAWVAVSGVRSAEDGKELARRLRKGTGADLSASGATRIAGSVNYKGKYAPNFPLVTIMSAFPGRIVTTERLGDLGLLGEPLKAFAIDTHAAHNTPARVSAGNCRPWPSYQITLARTRPKKDGTGPDRSLADFNYAMTCCTGGKSVEDTTAKLMEVSENAQQHAARGDDGYARITVENAAAAVARNYSKGRNRA